MPLSPKQNSQLARVTQIIEAIESAILASVGGPISVTVDGMTTRWDHDQADRQLARYRKLERRLEAIRDNGSPRTSTIKLSGGR